MQGAKVPADGGNEYTFLECVPSTWRPAVSHQEAFHTAHAQGLAAPYTTILSTRQKTWIVSGWLRLQAEMDYQGTQLFFLEVPENFLFHNIQSPSFWRSSIWGCTQASIPSYYSHTKKHIAQRYIWLS